MFADSGEIPEDQIGEKKKGEEKKKKERARNGWVKTNRENFERERERERLIYT